MNTRLAGTWGAVLVLGLGLAAGAQADVDGPQLYKENCIKCHGEKGQATTWRGILFFARNFTSPKWQAKMTDEKILEEINEGPRIMPAFEDKLTLEERQALVKVVRDFGKVE